MSRLNPFWWLKVLYAQGEIIMAKIDELKDLLDRVNAATDNIAADIKNLSGQIGTGMSDADVATVQAGLEAAAVKLEAVAAETPDKTV